MFLFDFSHIANFFHLGKNNSRVSDAKHPMQLIQLFAFILKVKYSKGFRERGALRVCNGPVDGVPVGSRFYKPL